MNAWLQQNPFPVFSWPKKLLDHEETASKMTVLTRERVLLLLSHLSCCSLHDAPLKRKPWTPLCLDCVYVNHCLQYGSTLHRYDLTKGFKLN